jgi:acyl dehydratase
VRADQARLYSEGSRIWNPIHTDAGAAAAAGLPAPILHGTCTLAMATSAALALAGVADASGPRRITARFAGMVLMPSSLELRMTRRAERELRFEVFDPQGAAVIRDGHLTL